MPINGPSEGIGLVTWGLETDLVSILDPGATINGPSEGLGLATLGLETDLETIAGECEPTAPLIVASTISDTITIDILVASQHVSKYYAFYKEGEGAYQQWGDDFLTNSVTITGLNSGSTYTVKITGVGVDSSVDSNEVTLRVIGDSYTTIEASFVAWLRSATSYDANHVIFADQNMPKPTRPYITLRINTFTQPDNPYNGNVSATGARGVYNTKEFVLNLESYVDPGSSPIPVLLAVYESLFVTTHYNILETAGIAFIDNLLGPVNTPKMRDGDKYEPRAIMDLRFRIPYVTSDTGAGIINTVNYEGTYKIGDTTVAQISETVTNQ